MATPSASKGVSIASLAGAAFISILVGILIALFVIPRPTRGLQTIKVSPGNPLSDGPTVYPEEQPIRMRYGDIVKWVATNGGRVEIHFKAKDFDPKTLNHGMKEPPFIGGKPDVDQPINCASYSCTSLDINDNLATYLKSNLNNFLTYKYTQVLDGYSRDGKIIIRW